MEEISKSLSPELLSYFQPNFAQSILKVAIETPLYKGWDLTVSPTAL